jgi:hypothetical protein
VLGSSTSIQEADEKVAMSQARADGAASAN